ncbi:MAG: hypothetical protein PVI59_07225 [Anaerolineae bacterium]|jgi:hypothetical protein
MKRVAHQVQRQESRGRLLRLVHLIVLAVLLLPALQPLLDGEFTCGFDNDFHLWRAVELEELLRQGVLFSRWAPHMAHGYGYPLYNFSAPASAYVAALLHLAGLSWAWALNLTFIIGWLLSVGTIYLFVSDLLDRPAGLVAAVLYAYVPFHAYDVFYRGGLSQASAWFWPPLILWALRRADRRWGFVVAALGVAGLALTHNAFALLFAPLLLAYILLVARQRGRHTALWGGLAFAVGLGASAFFWLPALSDLRFVHSERLSSAWVFQYASNFLPLDQLFALPRTSDPSLLNDWPARGLGLIPALVALLGLTGLRRRALRLQVGFFAVALGLLVFLVLPISRPVWDVLTPLQRVQFPWRLVGPAALCAAVLSGVGAHQLSSFLSPSPRPSSSGKAGDGGSDVWTVFVPLGLMVLLLVPHLGWFYPRHCPVPQPSSLAGMLAWERASDTVGTTASGEFLPRWVEQTPAGTELEDQIAAGGPVQRFDESRLPEGATLLAAAYHSLGAEITLDTPIAFEARYLAFYFPGWKVMVDGQSVPVTATHPEGLIAFQVPAGRHEIVVRFGETPLRWVADVVSILSLLATAGLMVRGQGAARRTDPLVPRRTSLSSVLLLLGATAGIVLLKLTLIDRVPNPLRRPNLAGGHLQRVDVPAQLIFDGQYRLLGYDDLPDRVRADQSIPVRLYWQDVVPGGPSYRPSLVLQDEDGQAWNDPALRPSRWEREPPSASIWAPDEYALTAVQLDPLVGTPPGEYSVMLGAFDLETLTPFPAYDASGEQLGMDVPLGRVEVLRPRRVADVVPAQHQVDEAFGPVRLAGYGLDRETAAPGDPVFLTLFWRVNQAPEEDLTVRLRLVDSGGETATAYDLPPVRETFPPTMWQAGDLWRGRHSFTLPASLGDGAYHWVLRVCRGEGADCSPLGSRVDLGTLEVSALERRWEPPPLDVAVDAPLGDVVTLLGATLEPSLRDLEPGTSLAVTLVWRAEAEMTTSYRVFLHLVGPDGGMVDQSDGEPANWTRPTTGWLPGEVVLDQRVLSLPGELTPGEYRLVAGLYTVEGGRLVTPAGLDAVVLAELEVDEL